MAAYLKLFPQSKMVFWLPSPHGGSLHEVPLAWVVTGWMLFVPVNLARYIGSGYAGLAPFAAIVAGTIVGLACGAVLAQRERLLVSWWDDDVGAETK